jgi:hypothetical protein
MRGLLPSTVTVLVVGLLARLAVVTRMASLLLSPLKSTGFAPMEQA